MMNKSLSEAHICVIRRFKSYRVYFTRDYYFSSAEALKMAINKKTRANNVSNVYPCLFIYSHLAFAERRKSNYAIKLLFRGMIKRIAFVGVGKAHGLIVLGIGKQTGGRF